MSEKLKPKFETDVVINDDEIKIHISGYANVHLESKDGSTSIKKKWKAEKDIKIGLKDKITEDKINEIIEKIEDEVETKTEEMNERFSSFLNKLRKKWKIKKIEW